MDLEEVTGNAYRNESTRQFDRDYSHLLNLGRRPILHYGKLEYENVAHSLLERSREFGFFVGVTKSFLEELGVLSESTYKSMLSDYGYISSIKTRDNIQVIFPTEKLIMNKTTLMKKM
jgi:hypothetical protein